MGKIGHYSHGFGRVQQTLAGALIALTGISSQMLDISPSPDQTATHVFFGLLLNVGIVLRFHYGFWAHLPRPNVAQITDFVRQSSRLIYLLLYGLLLVKLLLSISHGIALPPKGFGPYLVAGALAQFLTRALAYASWRKSRMAILPARPPSAR